MNKSRLLVTSLFLCIMLMSSMPALAEQPNRLTFSLHAMGSSYIYWIDRFYNSSGASNFAGTSMVEEGIIGGSPFPVYILEEGTVHAAGNLYVTWTTNDGSQHELIVSLFNTEETSGGYYMLEEGDPTHPWGLCGMFLPTYYHPLTFKGWHIYEGIKEKISGATGIVAGCHLKAPDGSGTTVDKWWIIWTYLEIHGNLVAIQFTELTLPNWSHGEGEISYVPAAQTLTVQIRLI